MMLDNHNHCKDTCYLPIYTEYFSENESLPQLVRSDFVYILVINVIEKLELSVIMRIVVRLATC